jgi:hypothetical protein
MSNDLSYLDENGNTVFTAKYLQKRGSCCKSACVHCPYGFTLKKHGLQFREVLEADFALLEEIMRRSGTTAVDWKSFWPEHVRLIEIKSRTCGFFLKNNLVLKHVYLLPEFQHQELSKEMVESYFFI